MNTFTDAGLPEARPRILVAGLGNSILQDDGVGVHAALALAADPPEGVLAVEVGTAVLDALHLFEWADHILAIDAMEGGGAPGDVYLLRAGGVAEKPVEASLHELSLKASLRFAATPVTDDIVVIGVEPQCIHFGLELTPAVQASLPRVVALAREVIARWQDDAASADALSAVVSLVGAVPLGRHGGA